MPATLKASAASAMTMPLLFCAKVNKNNEEGAVIHSGLSQKIHLRIPDCTIYLTHIAPLMDFIGHQPLRRQWAPYLLLLTWRRNNSEEILALKINKSISERVPF